MDEKVCDLDMGTANEYPIRERTRSRNIFFFIVLSLLSFEYNIHIRI